FHARSALSVRVPLPAAKYSKEQRIQFFRALVAQVSALPGVRAAGVVSRIPLGGGSSSGNYSILGRPPADDEHQSYAERRVVSEGFGGDGPGGARRPRPDGASAGGEGPDRAARPGAAGDAGADHRAGDRAERRPAAAGGATAHRIRRSGAAAGRARDLRRGLV